MSPRDKYDECDVLVQTGFHCLISSFSVSLSFSVFLVKTTVSFPFLGSFHLEFQNTQLCSLLIPLSVFSGSLCSSFLAARSNFRFSEKINSNLMTKLSSAVTVVLHKRQLTFSSQIKSKTSLSRGDIIPGTLYEGNNAFGWLSI